MADNKTLLGLNPTSVAAVAATLGTVLFCLNSELLQALQVHQGKEEKSPSPMFNLWLCHLGGLFLAPWYAQYRDAYRPSKEMQGLLGGEVGGGCIGTLAARPRMTALLFAFLLMGYNYAWLLGSTFVPAQVTNAIFQVSIAFVYVASIPLFGEEVSSMKIVGVVTAVAGSFLAGGFLTFGDAASHFISGAMFALLAAVGVAAYQVLFRHVFGHLSHQVDFLGFFYSWLSIWHILAITPLVLAVSFVGWEPLQLPSGTSAIAGTVLSVIMASTVNFLYLFAITLGSPMLFPCASILTIPLSVILDAFFHGLQPTTPEWYGHFFILASVVLILQPWKVLFKDGEDGDSPLTMTLNSLTKSSSGKQHADDDPFLVKGIDAA